MFNYLAFGATDVGLSRSNNEDAFFVLPQSGVFVVADGMGGAAAGEVASAIFVQAVDEVFDRSPVASADDAAALVREAFGLAYRRMIDDVGARPSHQGMGCTAELLVFYGDRYVLGHVGDSRTYLLREGELRQITKDHSLVQQLVDQGHITGMEARRHPLKNVVLNALGADSELSLDLIPGRVYPEDLFLLCSDGLTDLLEDQEIGRVLRSPRTLAEKVKLLIDGAKTGGGRDNVTVVLCQALQ